MKLLNKTSVNYAWVSIIVLIITSFMLFIFLRDEVSAEISEQLELQSEMVVNEIRKGNRIDFPLIKIVEGDEAILTQPEVFRDTLIYDYLQQEKEGYLYFSQSKKINGKAYRITVMTSYIGWHRYSQTIGYIFIAIACMLVVLGSLVNYFINRKFWKPFLLNLKLLKSYSVSAKEDLTLIPSDIDEFQELNMALTDLASRAKKEYTGLKEFTENASHEIQTPLSILQSRLESISQRPMDEDLSRFLTDAKQALNRLSRVNKSLLLLAKLENNIFPDQQMISLDAILNANVNQMEDLFQHRGMTVIREIKDKQVFASPSLMEILISNLLSNALAHSTPDAQVYVRLDDQKMKFCNGGKALEFEASKLFTRFGKGVVGYNGNGLGLSIVKQICVLNNWEIEYQYKENMHIFQILFPGL